MTRPSPRASIAPPIILVQMKQWVRLRSMKRRQVARSDFSIATSTLRPPTLLTRMSIGALRRAPAGKDPRRPRDRRYRRRRSRPFDRVRAPRPRFAASASGSRATSMTSAPASAAASAIARPNPRLPPVTRMHLPSSRNWSSTVMSQTPLVLVAHSFSRWRLRAKHRSLATEHFDLCAFSAPTRRAAASLGPIRAGQPSGRDFCVKRAGTRRHIGRS